MAPQSTGCASSSSDIPSLLVDVQVERASSSADVNEAARKQDNHAGSVTPLGSSPWFIFLLSLLGSFTGYRLHGRVLDRLFRDLLASVRKHRSAYSRLLCTCMPNVRRKLRAATAANRRQCSPVGPSPVAVDGGQSSQRPSPLAEMHGNSRGAFGDCACVDVADWVGVDALAHSSQVGDDGHNDELRILELVSEVTKEADAL